MPLIICEVFLDLNWLENCAIYEANRATTFTMISAKLHASVVTLSTPDNTKLLQQLKSVFKWKVNWNKYQSKKLTKRQNQYLDFLISPSFQRANSLFVLYFENGLLN